MNPVILVSVILAGVALSAALFLHFDGKYKTALAAVVYSQRQEVARLKADILGEFKIFSSYMNSEFDDVHRSVDSSIAKLTTHAAGELASFRESALRMHTVATGVLTTAHGDVTGAKDDILREVKKLHDKVDAVEVAATKGYDIAKDHLVQAAKSVLHAPRRICDTCKRMVHSFEIGADGLVKCTDCKHRG